MQGKPGKDRKASMKLRIILVGAIDPEIVAILKRGIEDMFPSDVRLGDGLRPSIEAYDADRGQYSAEVILNDLAQLEIEDQEHILGLADCDLYIPELTFVFGAALGTAALVSVTRLRQEFYSLQADGDLLTRRILTEAVHEIGHTYGMRHCFDPGCVMFFSRNIADTDRKGFNLCDRCEETLSRLSKPLLEISEDDPRLRPSLNIML